MARIPIVVGNWKLQKTINEALALVTELKNQLGSVREVEVGVAPVATALHAVVKRCEDSNVAVYGQNCHWEERGAFTGELAASLLVDAGAAGVIVGHSERRTIFGETDDVVARKVRAALATGTRVIACVGETEGERDAGQTEARVRTQMDAVLGAVQPAQVDRLVVAYEPVWAIGTGRTATPAQAQEVHAFIRTMLEGAFGAAVAQSVRIQYGGSVKPDNAVELMRQEDIDGALVGGASLKAEDFTAIVKAARPRG
ncbi:MAG TPA: triose-phosphate isomerase [Kofleriaceae bacterium]|nr:triose-phosphate isomerase [Kofleriaceae bacterium]